ncbi:MAG: deoxynucleoside kinase, partial [Anaerolineales bacterium]|nr:deoxynucleoside kinase [Anaerolineales bacterium]
LAEKIPLPDLVIYLRADIDVLMQRIALRDRPYERNMERTYIENLAQAYDNFYLGDQDASTERTVPVLTIDTNNLDYVRHADNLKLVENRLRQALKLEPFQAELPINNPIE